MFQVNAVVGGLIGGAVGAFIWAAVVYFTEYEIGWIAWGVGGLVGYGVAAGNRGAARSSTAAGVLAVAISAVAILAGKYAGVQLVMPSDDEILAMATAGFEEEDYVISYVADDVAAEYEAAGLPVSWPSGVDPTNASASPDYPADVWAEAEARWAELTDEQRNVFRDQLEAEVRENIAGNLPQIRSAMAGGGFVGSFSPMDVIFFGLAMVTAFGVASGGPKTQEEIAEEYAQAVQLAMIRVMLADGSVDPQEVRRIAEVYHELTGAEVSAEVIQAKATLALSGGRDLGAALSELAPHLSDEGKATVLESALRIAVADGAFEASERALLEEIAAALGVSETQMREAVAGLTQAGV